MGKGDGGISLETVGVQEWRSSIVQSFLRGKMGTVRARSTWFDRPGDVVRVVETSSSGLLLSEVTYSTVSHSAVKAIYVGENDAFASHCVEEYHDVGDSVVIPLCDA